MSSEWTAKFLEKILELRKRNVKITSITVNEHGNDLLISDHSLDVTHVNGYSRSIRVADETVPVNVNMGLRNAVIVIEYKDRSGIPQSTSVHREA